MSPSGLARAAIGELPAWACVSAERHVHIARVAALLTEWAAWLAPENTGLWRAAAWLHDALRDADPALLRAQVGPEFQAWPAALLHGPAAAAQLRRDDPDAPPELVLAVAYHTVGHPQLDALGRCLYLADFLEPGRSFSPAWRAALRARMPGAFDAILKEVAAARIAHLSQVGSALRPETIDFWNAISRA